MSYNKPELQTNIRTDIQLLQYPRYQDFVKASKEDIINLIDGNKQFKRKYARNLDYYIGKNTTINKRPNLDPDNPDSRIGVSYSRTFVQIIKGYMYKPGLVTYTSEDQAYLDRLLDIFEKNLEPLKTSELGENQCKYGLGVELLYTSKEDNETIPRFSSVSPEECIFIFNMEIEAKLIGAIRYYLIEQKDAAKTYRVEVYFKDRVEVYTLEESNNNKTLTFNEDYPNFFGDVPFAFYANNQEYHADYEPLQPLMDAYDVMCSDAINELNRFASAYLILKEYIFSNPNDANEKANELSKLKTRRVLEFMSGEGGAEFLTKDIPSEFFEVIKRTIREDIEYHSHIPDFRSKSFEAKSGVAMEWSLFDFENLCSDKQA